MRIVSIIAAGLGAVLLTVLHPALADDEFVSTFTFPGGSIYGYPPVPQTNGFDYYFTDLAIDPTVLGTGIIVDSIEVSAFGQNRGSVVNFDWEVHIGSETFGFPEGQFSQTLVDPILGYSRIAPTQFRFVIGNRFDTQSYAFSGFHDFNTGTTNASPYLSAVQAAFTAPLNLASGLHAQVFLWTADNRNSRVDFGEITLVVRGRIPAVPVNIDIKPGVDSNDINPWSGQRITVAILTTDDFDATHVDPLTTSFGPSDAAEVHGRGHLEDVDWDGDIDLVLHFAIQDTGLSCDSSQATLQGKTFDGQPVSGSDAVTPVPCKN